MSITCVSYILQSGRKPSGICGAALYISALAHGLNCSKSDVVSVVGHNIYYGRYIYLIR